MLVRAALGTDPLAPARLAPADVVAFITSLRGRFSPGSMRTVRSTLRSFFRFLRFEGFCGDELEAALPAVAHWRLAALPRSLTDQQVGQVLASFEVSLPCRQRDHAIVQCLSTLGLRPGEVADLCLDDIDWRDGTIEVRTRKNRRGAQQLGVERGSPARRPSVRSPGPASRRCRRGSGSDTSTRSPGRRPRGR